MNTTARLRQLYKLIEMIDAASLGNDWESKRELRTIRSKAVDEIKQIEQDLRDKDMVK
jgi:hypothetical protein